MLLPFKNTSPEPRMVIMVRRRFATPPAQRDRAISMVAAVVRPPAKQYPFIGWDVIKCRDVCSEKQEDGRYPL